MLKCIDDVLDASQLEGVAALIARGHFVDGRATAGERASRVKKNLQLDPHSTEGSKAGALLSSALRGHGEFKQFAYPRFLSNPIVSRYEPGMEYGNHVDDAIMGQPVPIRSDLAVTVFLSDPERYVGGELVLETSIGSLAIKLPRGHAVVYAANTIHRVAPVTSGERLAAFAWVQSYVRDPSKREMLFDLDRIKRCLRENLPDAQETDLAAKTHSNLLRIWAEA